MKIDLVRAWKDPEYRKSLTAEQLASLPPNPAGVGELSDEELESVAGGSAESIGTFAKSSAVPSFAPPQRRCSTRMAPLWGG